MVNQQGCGEAGFPESRISEGNESKPRRKPTPISFSGPRDSVISAACSCFDLQEQAFTNSFSWSQE